MDCSEIKVKCDTERRKHTMGKREDNIFGTPAWEAFEADFRVLDEEIQKIQGPSIPSDAIEVKNTPVDLLRNSMQTLLRLDIDKSGSMQGFNNAMRKALELVKESIVTSEEVCRIQIAKTLFSNMVTPEGYTDVEKFDTSYTAGNGSTKLYDSIIDSERRINEYENDLKKYGVIVKKVLCILSDGLDNDSISSFDDAKASIERMKKNDVTVCFIAFGSDDCKKLAEQLGVVNIIHTDATVHELHKIMKFVSLSTIQISQGTKD